MPLNAHNTVSDRFITLYSMDPRDMESGVADRGAEVDQCAQKVNKAM